MAQIDQNKIQEAKRVVKSKIKEWYSNIRKLKLEDLEPNIFLAAALGITNAKDFVEFYARQHIERSIVTSFGFLIEEVAAIIGKNVEKRRKGEKLKGWNLKTIKDGEEYYIEVKSGPHSCNKDMLQSISKEQEKIRKAKPDAKICLGLLYGRKEEVFGTIRIYYRGDEVFVGKEFWEFISEDPEAYKKVLKLIIEAHEEVLQESLEKKTLLQVINEKVDELAKEWRKKYGDKLDYNEMLKKFF